MLLNPSLPFPTDRAPAAQPLASPAQPWYAIKVRVSGEERVGKALQNKGYEVFLPTRLESKRYSDRIRKVQAPLFPGYLFARVDIERRLPILQTTGVEHIVGFGNVPHPISETEIHAIQTVVRAGIETEPWSYLETGDPVTIQHGSLTGVTGQMLQFKGKDRLVLSIHLLQRSISVEIDRAWVRPAQDPYSFRFRTAAGI